MSNSYNCTLHTDSVGINERYTQEIEAWTVPPELQ